IVVGVAIIVVVAVVIVVVIGVVIIVVVGVVVIVVAVIVSVAAVFVEDAFCIAFEVARHLFGVVEQLSCLQQVGLKYGDGGGGFVHRVIGLVEDVLPLVLRL